MRYGEAVEVEYVDMADPESQTEYPEVLAVIEDRDLTKLKKPPHRWNKERTSLHEFTPRT